MHEPPRRQCRRRREQRPRYGTGEGGTTRRPLFANDGQLDNLRNDPGFIAFMTKLNAECEERKQSLLQD
jgi:hypothetical protein